MNKRRKEDLFVKSLKEVIRQRQSTQNDRDIAYSKYDLASCSCSNVILS
jgi:hypothetical protein